MKGFLDYALGDTFFHHLNPLIKLLISLLISIAAFISGSHLFIAALIALNLVMAARAGIFQRGVMLLAGLLKFSAFIFILQLLLVRRGNPLLHLPLNLVITDAGLSSAFLIVLRLIAGTMPLAIMLSITQMSDLSNVLVLKCKVPYKYAFALTTAIRFIPIFAGEMAGIIEAQTSRGVEMDTKNLFKKVGLILPLCVPLLITSVKKIEDSAISAEIRGFHLRTGQSCYKRYMVTAGDMAVLAFSAMLIALACIF
ncbi:MAG: energy-coupling factor transporter transmembrane protein EcfT [Clostridiaceae bacterium]|nr:energy-coupling factor transporter transmembrane protein EcfT [Clostridiaceae bacterium]